MKKILLLIHFLFMLLSSANAQSPQQALKSSQIVSFYNDARYDSIWRLFSKNMQNNLPLDKTTQFFSGVNNYYGKIEQSAYAYEQAGLATFKITFTKGVMALNFKLDNDDNISAISVTRFIPGDLPQLERNTTKLILPFNGEWIIFWGGDTKEQNQHADVRAQKYAFDMLKVNEHGKSYKTDGKANEDYYAFGQAVIAPCDAEVVLAVDGVKDNKPGDQNPVYLPGNSVILKTRNNEYMLLAHFKQHSVQVKEGDKVKQGQLLGYCGNSGNSSEPHLHVHIQNVEDMNMATGAKCYFDKIIVNGVLKTDYSPVKNDKVGNVKLRK